MITVIGFPKWKGKPRRNYWYRSWRHSHTSLGKPDHLSSVRGVGFGVTQSVYFGKQKSSKGNDEVIKAMEEKMTALQEQMSIMAAQMASFAQAKP